MTTYNDIKSKLMRYDHVLNKIEIAALYDGLLPEGGVMTIVALPEEHWDEFYRRLEAAIRVREELRNG